MLSGIRMSFFILQVTRATEVKIEENCKCDVRCNAIFYSKNFQNKYEHALRTKLFWKNECRNFAKIYSKISFTSHSHSIAIAQTIPNSVYFKLMLLFLVEKKAIKMNIEMKNNKITERNWCCVIWFFLFPRRYTEHCKKNLRRFLAYLSTEKWIKIYYPFCAYP